MKDVERLRIIFEKMEWYLDEELYEDDFGDLKDDYLALRRHFYNIYNYIEDFKQWDKETWEDFLGTDLTGKRYLVYDEANIEFENQWYAFENEEELEKFFFPEGGKNNADSLGAIYNQFGDFIYEI